MITSIRTLLALFSVLLQGCASVVYSVGAVSSLPQAASLNKGEPIHLALRVALTFDEKSYEVTHYWHCDQSRNFQLNDGKWHLTYKSDQSAFFKSLDPALGVFVRLPGCHPENDSSPTAGAEIFLFPNTENLDLAIPLTEPSLEKPNAVPSILKSVNFSRTVDATEDSQMTLPEVRLFNQVRSAKYESVSGWAYSKEAWSQTTTLATALNSLETIFAAPQEHTRSARTFPGFAELRNLKPAPHRVFFQYREDSWVYEAAASFRVLRRLPHDQSTQKVIPSTVRYNDFVVPKANGETQIFDPSSMQLISIYQYDFHI